MTDVETAIPNLSEALTWAQICERYPDQWVVLVDVDWVEKDDDNLTFDFHSAHVASHGPTRRETLVQAQPLRARYPHMAHYFTGQLRIRTDRPRLPEAVQLRDPLG